MPPISVASPKYQKHKVSHSNMEKKMAPHPLRALAPNTDLPLREFAFCLGSLHTSKKTS